LEQVGAITLRDSGLGIPQASTTRYSGCCRRSRDLVALHYGRSSVVQDLIAESPVPSPESRYLSPFSLCPTPLA
jgi:hypothetical protein